MQPPGYPPPPYGAPQYQQQQPPQYGRPPFQSQHGAGGPPKKSSLGLIIGLGVGAVVVVGGLVGGGVWAYGHFRHGSLPLDAKQMPTQTREIHTTVLDATREPDERIKNIYLASELGVAFCSGHSDPAARLESIATWGTKTAKEFFDPTNLDAVRGTLECGSELAKNLDDVHASYLVFDADEDPKGGGSSKHRVKIGHFKMKTMPASEGYTSVSFGTLAGFCQTTTPVYAAPSSSSTASPLGTLIPPPVGSSATPSTKACDDKSQATFAVGSTWFFSDKLALDELAKGITVPKATLGARLAAMQDAFNATSNLPYVSVIAEPKTSKDFLQYPCEWAATELGIHYSSYGATSTPDASKISTREEFLTACFPGKSESKLIEDIDAKLRAIAFETDPDYVKAGAVTGNIVLVARDTEAGEETERVVKELVTEWKSQLDINQAKLLKAGKDQASSIKQKKFADVADTYFKSLLQMKISRDGRVVKIGYKAAFTKEDRQELIDEDKPANDKRLPVTEILEAIRDKKIIPQSSLAKLVGPSWAAYLVLPPIKPAGPAVKVTLSKQECRDLQAKLSASSIHMSDLPTTGDSQKAFIDHRYGSCESKQPEVTETQQKCLTTFSTASDYAACMGGDTFDSRQPPESEFGKSKQ